MQLVADGTLDLDKRVEEYLPSRTSGFPNLRWLSPDRKLNTNFAQGSRYAYSGEGIQLLQLVVETISGKPMRGTIQEGVFRPLDKFQRK